MQRQHKICFKVFWVKVPTYKNKTFAYNCRLGTFKRIQPTVFKTSENKFDM